MQKQTFKPATKADSNSHNTIYLFSEEGKSREIFTCLTAADIPKNHIAWDNTGGGKEAVGFTIEIEHLPKVKKICEKYGYTSHEVPLNGMSFDEIKLSSVIDYLEQKKADIATSYPEIINEYKILEKAIEKRKPQAITQELDIKFVHENEVNLFKEQPPIAPTLITIIENGYQHDFLRKGIVGQLVGAGGIGKTHFLTQLALSVATGIPFLGDKFSVSEGYVFLGLGENTDDDIHRLLKKMSVPFNGNDTLINKACKRVAVKSFCGMDASFVDRNGKLTLFFEAFLDVLKAKEPEEGWSLIVLDPISRFLGAQAENDNAAATLFISLLERMSQELKGNPTVLFGHHMSKSGFGNTDTDQTAARGSSALTDGVRWQANLERVTKNDKEIDRNKVRFKVVKSNFTRLYEPLILEKDHNGCLKQEQKSANENYTESESSTHVKRLMNS